jgi:hypothetical protein
MGKKSQARVITLGILNHLQFLIISLGERERPEQRRGQLIHVSFTLSRASRSAIGKLFIRMDSTISPSAWAI